MADEWVDMLGTIGPARLVSFRVSKPVLRGEIAQTYFDEKHTEEGPSSFEAPVDLQIGDICRIRITDSGLSSVVRGDKIIWYKRMRL